MNKTRRLQRGEINPCIDKLSDVEYLEHMIPHHQVAIDMSRLLQPVTKSDIMLNVCRDIIRKQSFEIYEMKGMKSYKGVLFSNDTGVREFIQTTNDVYNNNLTNQTKCNPLFFKPNDHSKMMKSMKINDRSYLEHMIPHHQVAINMTRRLLLHTHNSYLLNFSRKLILDQQNEIIYMKGLLDENNYLYKSELLFEN